MIPWILNKAFLAKNNLIYKSIFRVPVNTYIHKFLGVDTLIWNNN